jgi:hypothetical protein
MVEHRPTQGGSVKRWQWVAFGAALVVAMAVGALVALNGGNEPSAAAPATTSSAPTRDDELIYLQALRDLGYVESDIDAELLVAKGRRHCDDLALGLGRDEILKDTATLAGTARRVRDEAVFDLAVQAFCPQRAPFITKSTAPGQ